MPMRLSALALLCLAAPLAAQPIAERIAAVPGDPYTDVWSEPVRLALLAAYDADDSGTLDTAEEVDAVACEVWTALETTVEGVLDIYGFTPDYLWVGGALGFAESMRAEGYAAGLRCLTASPEPPDAPDGAVATRIRALEEPSTYAWKLATGRLLISHYDADGSGVLDTTEEADAVACDVWEAIEDGYAQGEYDRFWIGYGIKDAEYLGWNANGLGLDESIRADAWEAVQRCLPAAR